MRSLSSALLAAQKAMGQRISKVVLTFTPVIWVANTAYTLGERVEPTSANTYLYSCIKAGTSSGTQPTWPTTIGGTVTDGTTKWQNIGLKSQTYTRVGTTARILNIEPHIEATDTQQAIILLNNSDKYLTDCDLKGFQAVISYGYIATYSACATLWVVGQNNYSLRSGRLVTVLECIGIPDLLQRETANADYLPVETRDTWISGRTYIVGDWVQPTTPNDYSYKCTVAGTSAAEPTWSTTIGGTTNDNDVRWTTYPKYISTVKALIVCILGATMPCFNHCKAYTSALSTLIIDWEDALFDSFQPKDSFRIVQGESRWSVVQRLLSYTRMVLRAKAGAEIHLFSPMRIEDKETWQATHAYYYDDVVEPTTPNGYLYTPSAEGTSGGTEPTWPTTIGGTVVDGTVTWMVAYHAKYYTPTTSGEHDFFDKNSRERIVIPGYVKVESYPLSDGAAQFSGIAQDDAYDTYPTHLKIQDIRKMRVASDAEALSVATALLRGHQLQAEKGSGWLPMDVGLEVYDFVYLVDSRAGDTRIGIVQYINRRDGMIDFDMRISFAPFTTKPSMLQFFRETEEQVTFRVMAERLQEHDKQFRELTLTILKMGELTKENTRKVDSLWEDSYFRDRPVYIQALANDTALTTGDGKFLWTVPADFNGYILVDADAVIDTVSSSGTPTFQIHNLTDAQDMLSTLITILVNQKNSYTATAQPVINQAYDDVATGDILRFDCDVAGTGVTGLAFALRFRKK